MYDRERGVPRDYGEAAKGHRKAAEQGDVRAQFNLGHVYAYAKGECVPQDNVQALMWWNLAAAQDDNRARTHRNFVANNLTLAESRGRAPSAGVEAEV